MNRLDVSDWHVVEIEASGDDRKEWTADPEDPRCRWLFKPVTVTRTGTVTTGRSPFRSPGES